MKRVLIVVALVAAGAAVAKLLRERRPLAPPPWRELAHAAYGRAADHFPAVRAERLTQEVAALRERVEQLDGLIERAYALQYLDAVRGERAAGAAGASAGQPGA